MPEDISSVKCGYVALSPTSIQQLFCKTHAGDSACSVTMTLSSKLEICPIRVDLIRVPDGNIR